MPLTLGFIFFLLSAKDRMKIRRRISKSETPAAEALAATQVEGRKQVKRRVYEVMVLATAATWTPFLGMKKLFGGSREEDRGGDLERKGKTRREGKRDKRSAKGRGKG